MHTLFLYVQTHKTHLSEKFDTNKERVHFWITLEVYVIFQVSLVSILLMKLNQTPRVLQLECKKVCADCMQKAMKSKVSSKSLIFQTVSPNFVYKVTETYSTIFFQFYLLLFSHFSRKVVITFPLLIWKGMKSLDCIYLAKHGIYLQHFH